jgi:hypothetical protein
MKIMMAVSRSTACTVWGFMTAVFSESSSTVHAVVYAYCVLSDLPSVAVAGTRTESDPSRSHFFGTEFLCSSVTMCKSSGVACEVRLGLRTI